MEGDRAGSAAAVSPPVAPMLATLARELPGGEVLYEPKWDGFRCLAFRSPGAVELRSRHDRPLGRYFPELVEALSRLTAPAVLDGEIVIPAPGGFDFSALLTRLHPAASRVERLRHETPARYIAFDLLAVGSEDLRERPFTERRAALRELLADSPPPLHLSRARTTRLWRGAGSNSTEAASTAWWSRTATSRTAQERGRW
jgi:ATP-dependent DNA ligase